MKRKFIQVTDKIIGHYWCDDEELVKYTDFGENYVVANLHYALSDKGAAVTWVGNRDFIEKIEKESPNENAFLKSLEFIQEGINSHIGIEYIPSEVECHT